MLSPLGFLSGFPIHLFPVSIFTLKSVNTLIITALGFFQLFSTSGTTWVYFSWPWFLVTLLWFFTCLVILFIIIWILRMTHCTDAVFLSIETFWIFSGRQWTCLNSSSKLCVLWVAAAEVHIQFFPMLPAAFCGGGHGALTCLCGAAHQYFGQNLCSDFGVPSLAAPSLQDFPWTFPMLCSGSQVHWRMPLT